MGLSTDPEKRARQLANLNKGGQVAAERHGAAVASQEPFAGPANGSIQETPTASAARGALPVVGYSDPEPAPVSSTPPAPGVAMPPGAGDVDDDQEPDELDDRIDEQLRLLDSGSDRLLEGEGPAERGGLGGLVDGFLGR